MCRKLIIFCLASVLAISVSAQADYKSTVISDTPLSFWEFEDAASNDGATCADTMGMSPGQYRNKGAAVPDISLVSGLVGKAAQFTGTASSGNGAFVQIADSSYTSIPYRLESSPTCSIELLMKTAPTASELYSRLISHADGGSANYAIAINTTGANAGQPQIKGAGGTWYAWPPILADNNWHHVVVTYTYDGTNTTKELFIDGISRGTNSIAGVLAPPGAWQDLILGAEGNQNYVYNGYTGLLDEVAYYGYALSQARVTAHYNAIPEPATIALLGLGGLTLLRKRRA